MLLQRARFSIVPSTGQAAPDARPQRGGPPLQPVAEAARRLRSTGQPRPAPRRRSPSSSAARASARVHETGTSAPSWRSMGRVGRSGCSRDGLEAAAIAQPALVDVRVGARDESQHGLGAAVDLDVAADGAAVADRRGAHQVPRAGLEAVLATGQRADRAQLDRVAGEQRVVRLAVECGDLAVGAAIDGRQGFVARDLLVEADAAVAHDAALAVEHDLLAERERLFLVAFFFGEARGAGTVAERVVLERALAAFVADRAVERDGWPAAARARRSGRRRRRACWCGRSCPAATGVVQAVCRRGSFSICTRHMRHAPTGLSLGLVAEDRNLEADQLGRLDQAACPWALRLAARRWST